MKKIGDLKQKSDYLKPHQFFDFFMMDRDIIGDFALTCQIGEGAYGRIYVAAQMGSRRRVALKFATNEESKSSLENEHSIYSVISGNPGFANLVGFYQTSNGPMMAIDLLGNNIDKIFRHHNLKFTLKTVLMLADQMILRIQTLHNMGIIHRDIKPSNFTVGLDENRNTIYLIDFGMAEYYEDPVTHNHRENRLRRRIHGTTAFASLNSHRGMELSRRDDIESLAYVLIYFMRGSLPWIRTSEHTYEKKCSTSSKQLCDGLPDEFEMFLNYSRCLEFDEEPDYDMYRKMFKDLFLKEGLKNDYKFDWLDDMTRPRVLRQRSLTGIAKTNNHNLFITSQSFSKQPHSIKTKRQI